MIKLSEDMVEKAYLAFTACHPDNRSAVRAALAAILPDIEMAIREECLKKAEEASDVVDREYSHDYASGFHDAIDFFRTVPPPLDK